jgi:proteasome lid subunit RPN8/RPN11
VRIHAPALEAVLAHARAAWPQECCGVLLADGAAGATITRVLRAENEETSDPGRRYVLGRHAHLEAVELELAGRAHILGYYHSHPHAGPQPSCRDAELAAEEAVYLIVGLQQGRAEPAAWRWTPHGFAREPLQVPDSSPDTTRPIAFPRGA